MIVRGVSGVNSINSFIAGNNIGAVSRNSKVNRVSPVSNISANTQDVSAETEVAAFGGAERLASIFYNSDGDRAEISNKAMELFRDLSAYNSKDSYIGPEQARSGVDLVNQNNTPSSFVDWAKFAVSPGISTDYRGQILPDAPIPAASNSDGLPQNRIPPDVLPQGVLFPVNAPSGNTPPATAPTGKSSSVIGPDTPGVAPLKPAGECKTCANRRYVDGSDDPSVSFQTPTKISPNMAPLAVASHEQEHVRNEQGKAKREGREIVNQNVTLSYDCCPECGRMYVSGGTTRTTTVGKTGSNFEKNSGSNEERDAGPSQS